MAAITKRTNSDGSVSFKCQVRISGFPPRTASHRTERDARRWAATIEAAMVEGRHFRGAAARRHTVGDAIARYAEEHPGKDRAQLAFWSGRLGTIRLADLTPDLIAEVRGELSRGRYQRSKPTSKRTVLKDGESPQQFKRSGSTTNRYLASLSHVLSTARREWHWTESNPALDVRKLPEGQARSRVLTTDECTALLQQTASDPVLRTFILVALSTAARAGELQSLTWSDVDLAAGQLVFRDTKNGAPRSAWLTGEAKRLMEKLAREPHASTDQVFRNPTRRGSYAYHKRFKAALAAAGISGLVFHSLRHTSASWLAAQGATEAQLRAIGGWKSNAVNRYVHLAAVDTRDIVAKMNRQMLGTDR